MEANKEYKLIICEKLKTLLKVLDKISISHLLTILWRVLKTTWKLQFPQIQSLNGVNYHWVYLFLQFLLNFGKRKEKLKILTFFSIMQQLILDSSIYHFEITQLYIFSVSVSVTVSLFKLNYTIFLFLCFSVCFCFSVLTQLYNN